MCVCERQRESESKIERGCEREREREKLTECAFVSERETEIHIYTDTCLKSAPTPTPLAGSTFSSALDAPPSYHSSFKAPPSKNSSSKAPTSHNAASKPPASHHLASLHSLGGDIIRSPHPALISWGTFISSSGACSSLPTLISEPQTARPDLIIRSTRISVVLIIRSTRISVGTSLRGVPREQKKMLEGHLPRVMYHQVY